MHAPPPVMRLHVAWWSGDVQGNAGGAARQGLVLLGEPAALRSHRSDCFWPSIFLFVMLGYPLKKTDGNMYQFWIWLRL